MADSSYPPIDAEAEIAVRFRAIANLANMASRPPDNGFTAPILLDGIEGICQSIRRFLPPEAA